MLDHNPFHISIPRNKKHIFLTLKPEPRAGFKETNPGFPNQQPRWPRWEFPPYLRHFWRWRWSSSAQTMSSALLLWMATRNPGSTHQLREVGSWNPIICKVSKTSQVVGNGISEPSTLLLSKTTLKKLCTKWTNEWKLCLLFQVSWSWPNMVPKPRWWVPFQEFHFWWEKEICVKQTWNILD